MNRTFVCDTNVFISNLLVKGSAPAQTVEFIQRNGFFAFSQATLDELVTVLKREKFDQFITWEKREAFYQEMTQISRLFPIHTPVFLCRDAKDNKFLEAALASHSDYLVTGDEDLLVIKEIGNTPIITPREFIAHMTDEAF